MKQDTPEGYFDKHGTIEHYPPREEAPYGHDQRNANGQDRTGGAQSADKPLPFTKFDDVDESITKRWIVKGLIARGETSSWVGPPGSGKSSVLDDLAVNCARRDKSEYWYGHRIKQTCGVLIIALERGDLHKRRLAAYRQRDGLTGLPIAVVSAVIDLMTPDCIEIILATVSAAEAEFGCRFGMIAIDTYNKAIAIGGGDEDKAKDQNRIAANLRKVHEVLDVHIALVGHTGKDESRGARGSNAHLGDVDVMIQISNDGPVKVARVTKANDQPERDIVAFRLTVHEFAKDEDGDPIDVSVIEPCEGGAANATKSKLSVPERAALHELNECVADHAEPPPTDPHCPPGSKGVSLETWKKRLIDRSVIEKGERVKWGRIKNGLRDKGRIGIWDDYVWPRVPGGAGVTA